MPGKLLRAIIFRSLRTRLSCKIELTLGAAFAARALPGAQATRSRAPVLNVLRLRGISHGIHSRNLCVLGVEYPRGLTCFDQSVGYPFG